MVAKNDVMEGADAKKLIYHARSFANVAEDAFKLFTLVKYGF